MKNEYMIEPLRYFRNYFCYRIENNWSFKYKMLNRVGSLETNLFFVSFGIADVGLPKTFLQHFELCFYCKYL